MLRLKRRTFEILCEPSDNDKSAAIVSMFIIVLIVVNVALGVVETDPELGARYHNFFERFELISVIIFTLEYIGRLWSITLSDDHRRPLRGRLAFAMTPMAVIDLMAILPFFLQFFLPGLDLRFVRMLRLFRLVRIFKLGRYSESMMTMFNVVKRRQEELVLSIAVVFVTIVLNASIMWLFEHDAQPEKFRSAMSAMWWAIITVTTIGYGDLYPITVGGKIAGGIIGFLGICIFALPVGIIGSAFVEEMDEKRNRRLSSGHAPPQAVTRRPVAGGRMSVATTHEPPTQRSAVLDAVDASQGGGDPGLKEEVDYLRREVVYLREELQHARQQIEALRDDPEPPSS